MIADLISYLPFILFFLTMGYFVIRFAKLAKCLQKTSGKLTEESSRVRFELAKIAEEISALRKNQQDSKEVVNPQKNDSAV